MNFKKQFLRIWGNVIKLPLNVNLHSGAKIVKIFHPDIDHVFLKRTPSELLNRHSVPSGYATVTRNVSMHPSTQTAYATV